MNSYITADQAIALFICATVVFGVAAWWADKAASMANETITEGINKDYDIISDRFKYQTPGDQADAIRSFRERWKGRVSRARLDQFVVSLEEMRILCL